MATVKATILLPVEDNDGRDLASEIEETRNQLYLVFRAYTSEGLVQGAYKMADGRQASDLLQEFILLVDESLLSALEEVIRGFKAKTTQEAMYLEIQHGVEFRLI